MLELVAERGCGYVLMHIEGPPRVDREPPALRRPGRAPAAWFGERIERAALAAGVAEEQIALDPGLDFDLSVDDDLEILRRLGELRELGRRCSSPSRARTSSARCWRAPGRSRAPADEREAATLRRRRSPVAGAEVLRLHDAERARRAADRRGDHGRRPGDRPRAGWPPRRRSPPTAAGTIEAGRDDDAWSPTSEAANPRATGPPRWPRAGGGARRRRDRGAVLAPARGARGGRRGQRDRHQRHRVGQVAVLQPAGARRASARPRRAPLPLSDQGARPGPGAQARPSSAWRSFGTRSTTATRRATTAPRSGAARTSILTNPDMLHVGILPHHRGWGDFLAGLGWVVVDEAHTYRGVFGSHVANVLRRLRRVAALYGAEPRFVSPRRRSPTRSSSPSELVRRAVRAGRLRRRAAGPAADRDLEPAGDRPEDDDPALGALRGGRAARRPGRRGACGRSASCAAGAGSS